jgi:type IV secretion system protein VirD4
MLQWPGSVIAIDIKKEVFDITSGYRAKVGDVFVFDPGNEHGQTHRFNPLEGIALATDEAGRYDEIDRMAHVLLQNPKSGETHWVESARDLFKGVALHLGHGRASVCPSDVLHFLRSGEKPSAKIQRLREEGAIRSEKALGLLVSFATLADKEASSVLSTLLTGLNVYENPRVAAATAVSDFSFNDLRRKRSSIYLVSKYSDISRFGTLFASVFLRALSVLSREKPTPDEPLDVLLLMDEFANFGRMDYLLSAMAALAGYHIRIFIIVQSSHQVEERYSLAERRSIYEMCRYRAVYQPNALESSEEISKLLGTKTVTVRNRSMSMKGGSSTSIIEQARPLMLPQEVRRLGDDTVLIFAEGARPVKGRKSPFFADRLMKKRLYAAAPLPRSLSAPIETEIFVADFVAASTFIAQVEASANTSTELANF